MLTTGLVVFSSSTKTQYIIDLATASMEEGPNFSAPEMEQQRYNAALPKQPYSNGSAEFIFRPGQDSKKGYPRLVTLYPNGDKFGYLLVFTAAGMDQALQQTVFHEYGDLRRLYIVMVAENDRESTAVLRTIPTRRFPPRTSIVVGHLDNRLFVLMENILHKRSGGSNRPNLTVCFIESEMNHRRG